MFGHRRSRVRGDVLQRSRAAGPGDDHGRIVHGAVLFQFGHHRSHRGILLAHRDVEALDARIALIQDRVDGNRRLAGLAVADDQFPLPAADRGDRVYCFHPCLQRLAHRLPLGHARRQQFDRALHRAVDGAFLIQGPAKRVQHSSDHGVAGRDREQASERFDLVAFLDVQVIAQDDDSDAALFQIEGQAVHAIGELDHLVGHHVRQAVDAGDPVADLDHRADLADIDLALELFDLLLQDRCDFCRIEFHRCPLNRFKPPQHFAERLRDPLLGRPAPLLQTTAQTAVVHRVPDPNDQSAEQLWIELQGEVDAAAQHRFQPVGDLQLNRFGQFLRRRDQHVDATAPLVVQGHGGGKHGAQTIASPMPDDHFQEVQKRLRDLSCQRPIQQVLFDFGGDPRRSQQWLEAGNGVQQVGLERLELVQHLFDDTRFFGSTDQGFGVDLAQMLLCRIEYRPVPRGFRHRLIPDL
jgi:hypothetical protein